MYDKTFCEEELDVEPDDDAIDEFGVSEPFMTARQRIEIAREERLLRSILSDFDDWNELDGIENFSEFENFGDYYTDQFSA